MTLAPGSRRKHGLAHVRRVVAAGDFTPEDVARWTKEFGDSVADIVKALAPSKKKADKPATKPKE